MPVASYYIDAKNTMNQKNVMWMTNIWSVHLSQRHAERALHKVNWLAVVKEYDKKCWLAHDGPITMHSRITVSCMPVQPQDCLYSQFIAYLITFVCSCFINHVYITLRIHVFVHTLRMDQFVILSLVILMNDCIKQQHYNWHYCLWERKHQNWHCPVWVRK